MFPKKRTCDTPATPCDVLRRFLRRLRRFLRRFLRRLATLSATPCDAFCDALRRPAMPCDVLWRFLADSVSFGHVFPIFWKMRVTSQNFRCHVWFPPGLRIWTRKGSLWQRLCCCTVWQNQLSHFDGVFVLFHDLIANLHHFRFRSTTFCFVSETSSTRQGKRVLPRFPWFESMTAMQRKIRKVCGGFACWMSCPRLAASNPFKPWHTLWIASAQGILAQIEDPTEKGQSSVFKPYEVHPQKIFRSSIFTIKICRSTAILRYVLRITFSILEGQSSKGFEDLYSTRFADLLMGQCRDFSCRSISKLAVESPQGMVLECLGAMTC